MAKASRPTPPCDFLTEQIRQTQAARQAAVKRENAERRRLDRRLRVRDAFRAACRHFGHSVNGEAIDEKDQAPRRGVALITALRNRLADEGLSAWLEQFRVALDAAADSSSKTPALRHAFSLIGADWDKKELLGQLTGLAAHPHERWAVGDALDDIGMRFLGRLADADPDQPLTPPAFLPPEAAGPPQEPSFSDRLTVDLSTSSAVLDGQRFEGIDPDALRAFDVLVKAKVTDEHAALSSARIRDRLKNCHHDTTLARWLKMLPAPLVSCVKSRQGKGRWVSLPPLC
jgi:hypothetical protein